MCNFSASLCFKINLLRLQHCSSHIYIFNMKKIYTLCDFNICDWHRFISLSYKPSKQLVIFVQPQLVIGATVAIKLLHYMLLQWRWYTSTQVMITAWMSGCKGWIKKSVIIGEESNIQNSRISLEDMRVAGVFPHLNLPRLAYY